MPDIAKRAIALFVLLLSVAAAGVSATAAEFYQSLLRRGIASYHADNYEAAVRELDLAAFGLVESIDQFETAKVYSALAYDKLRMQTQARLAAQRVLAAERVQRRFAQIELPAPVRAAFVALAHRLLTAAEVAALINNAPVPPAPQATQPRVVQNPPPVPAPQPQTSTQTQPEPQPVTATPPVIEAPKPAPAVTTPPAPQQEPPKVIEERAVEFPAAKPDPPKPEPPKPEPPKPAPPKPVPAMPVRNVSDRLAAADRFLAQNNLVDARAIYRELIDVANLDHATLLALVEGAYRARDFAIVVRAFDRAGTLAKGEEPYRYYLAVALYETGQYARAKRELAAALPHIEITPSVARYQAKIEGAIESSR